MSLLTPGDFAEILAAIQSVTDTFFVSEVTYYQAIESLDPWQENREQTYTSFILSALTEFPSKDKEYEQLDGANEFFDITLTFNISDLEVAGCFDTITNRVIFNATKDYMECKGKKYQILFEGYDGPLQDKPVLYIIKGKLLANQY